ncbi:MAG: class I SAM-dependent methyltransferase, partial [Hydrogenimonas sp.]|nr:class I SAM-dependent methyltransferase [Hydrogenimonas sp.]
MPRIDHKLFYSKTVAKYGRCAQGVAWSDESRQKRRFAQLLRAIPDISKAAVVDAGCGFGDLWLFMRERGTLPKGYLGL